MSRAARQLSLLELAVSHAVSHQPSTDVALASPRADQAPLPVSQRPKSTGGARVRRASGRGPVLPPPELYRWDGARLVVTLPVKTKNEANSFARDWRVKAGLRARQRKEVARYLALCPRWTTLPVVVTVTRHSAGRLDQHDGLGSALKSVIDEIAMYLPLPRKTLRSKSGKEREHAEDSDPRVTWCLEQGKAPAKQTWVTVTFEERKDGVA